MRLMDHWLLVWLSQCQYDRQCYSHVVKVNIMISTEFLRFFIIILIERHRTDRPKRKRLSWSEVTR
jgi:hypothetical protein